MFESMTTDCPLHFNRHYVIATLKDGRVMLKLLKDGTFRINGKHTPLTAGAVLKSLNVITSTGANRVAEIRVTAYTLVN